MSWIHIYGGVVAHSKAAIGPSMVLKSNVMVIMALTIIEFYCNQADSGTHSPEVGGHVGYSDPA